MARKGKGSNKPNYKENKGKQYSNYRGKGSCAPEDRAEGSEQKGYNDSSWYTRYPNLLAAAGSFPYPYRPGMSFILMGAGAPGSDVTSPVYYDIPGVMSLEWMPSPGMTSSATDPASIAAKEIYAQVRSVYSGSLDADAPDFIMYLMALDSVFAYIAAIKRIYRLLVDWSPENYVLPDLVLRTIGFSPAAIEKLREDRIQLWEYINELVFMSRKFTCPAKMTMMNRHYWLSDNIFTDDTTLNSQLYVFNLAAVYQYASLPMPTGDDASGCQMIYVPWKVKNDPTAKELFEFGRNLIDTLVTWDDAYTISGYLKKAYAGTPMFAVSELPQNERYAAVYSPEVLSQIENSRTIPRGEYFATSTFKLDGFKITQDVTTNAILYDPSYTIPNTTSENNPTGIFRSGVSTAAITLSARSDNPTPVDNTIMSRFMCYPYKITEPVQPTNTWGVYLDVGTEIPIVWKYGVYRKHNPITNQYLVGTYNQYMVLDLTSDTSVDILRPLIDDMLAKFMIEAYDWHPFAWISIVVGEGSSANPYSFGGQMVGDVHNVTTITNEALHELHRVCTLSEWDAFEY